MAQLDVGSLPICGEDDRLMGMLTDRDIVVRVLAAGNDPTRTRAAELAQGEPITVAADDSAEDALHTMTEHRVRRLPVLDETCAHVRDRRLRARPQRGRAVARRQAPSLDVQMPRPRSPRHRQGRAPNRSSSAIAAGPSSSSIRSTRSSSSIRGAGFCTSVITSTRGKGLHLARQRFMACLLRRVPTREAR
jgi:hypothetical protein